MRENQNITREGPRIRARSPHHIVPVYVAPLSFLCPSAVILFLSLAVLSSTFSVFASSEIGADLNYNTDSTLTTFSSSSSSSSATPLFGSGGQPEAQTELTQDQQEYSIPADFTTYEDPLYGVRISYPSDWVPNEVRKTYENGVTSIIGFDYLSLTVEGLYRPGQSLEEFTADTINTYDESFDDFELIESNMNFYLGGMPATMILFSSDEDGDESRTLDISTKLGEKIYTVEYFTWAENFDLFFPTYEKVASTLEFIGLEQPYSGPNGGEGQADSGGDTGFGGTPVGPDDGDAGIIKPKF